MVEDYSFSVFPNENFLDLRLYQYGWERCAPLHSFGPFVRNHYLFHYVICGHGHLDSTDAEGVRRDYDLGPDQGFLICPGQISTYVADRDQPWKYVWLEFDGLRVSEFVESAGLDLNQAVYRPQSSSQGQRVRDIMLHMAENSDATPLHLTGMLFLFLDLLIQTSSTRRALHGVQLKDFYIQEAINYMERNYQRELSVEELADVCKLNRSYFSKLFKDSMGCPPQEFLIRLRLAHAADLMKGTRRTIGDIAMRCGYPNQLHFSRAFKKRYGVSPREWRQQNQIHQTRRDEGSL